MPEAQIILNYQRRPVPLCRRAQLKIRRLVHWIGIVIRRVAIVLRREIPRRKPWPLELFVFSWTVLALINVWRGIQLLRGQYVDESLVIRQWSIGFAAVVFAIAGMWGLVRQHRWRTLRLGLGWALLVAVASGLIQTRRCPHATYIQLFGITTPIDGNPCHNFQSLAPWWARP